MLRDLVQAYLLPTLVSGVTGALTAWLTRRWGFKSALANARCVELCRELTRLCERINTVRTDAVEYFLAGNGSSHEARARTTAVLQCECKSICEDIQDVRARGRLATGERADAGVDLIGLATEWLDAVTGGDFGGDFPAKSTSDSSLRSILATTSSLVDALHVVRRRADPITRAAKHRTAMPELPKGAG